MAINYSFIMYESNPRVLVPPPGLTPGHLTFLIFFGQIHHHAGLFLSNAPLPRGFLGVKCPTPRAEVTKPRFISGLEPERSFQHCHFYYFLYTSLMFTFIILFSVYIATTYGLGTSSVRSEHFNRLFQDKKKSKSTNQYILDFVTQECFQKVRYHQASTIGKEANPS